MVLAKTRSFTAVVGVALALFLSTMALVGSVCSNGLEGVQSTSLDVCCPEGCGTCVSTGYTPANTSSLTSGDCCATEVVESGIFCDVSGAAPCIITTAAASNDSVCINGQTGVQDPGTDVCCPLECGDDSCGGEGCGTIPGVDASQCCATAIVASGLICSDTVEPPCTVQASTSDSSATCSNGLSGIEDSDNLVCCDAACGLCGGEGCGDVSGLSGADCCSAEIELVGDLCSVTGAAPCVVDPPAVTPSMCPNGLEGVADGSVCCAVECNGVCGGIGCGSIGGTNGASDCCSATILATNIPCGTAPCVMVPGTYTNAPTAAPTVSPVTALTPSVTSAPTTTGDANGDDEIEEGDAVVPTPSPSPAPTAAPIAAPVTPPTTAPATAERESVATPVPTTSAPNTAPTAATSRTPSPSVINGNGSVDSQDGPWGRRKTRSPAYAIENSGNGALPSVLAPARSVHACVLVAALVVGGMAL